MNLNKLQCMIYGFIFIFFQTLLVASDIDKSDSLWYKQWNDEEGKPFSDFADPYVQMAQAYEFQHSIKNDQVGQKFCQLLAQAIKNNENIDEINDPIFIDLLAHIDDPEVQQKFSLYLRYNKYPFNISYNWLGGAISQSLELVRQQKNTIKPYFIEIAGMDAQVDFKTDIIALLLKLRVNPNNMGGDRFMSSLDKVAKYDALPIAEMLIEDGADVNLLSDSYQRTALFVAAENNAYKVAKFLIDHGAMIDQQDGDGRTALHIAAINDSDKVTQLLIAAGANLNLQTKVLKEAPLHYAAYFNSGKVAKLLLDAGVDASFKDAQGHKALAIAFKRQSNKVISVMSNIGWYQTGALALIAYIAYTSYQKNYSSLHH